MSDGCDHGLENSPFMNQNKYTHERRESYQ